MNSDKHIILILDWSSKDLIFKSLLTIISYEEFPTYSITSYWILSHCIAGALLIIFHHDLNFSRLWWLNRHPIVIKFPLLEFYGLRKHATSTPEFISILTSVFSLNGIGNNKISFTIDKRTTMHNSNILTASWINYLDFLFFSLWSSGIISRELQEQDAQ